MRRPYPGMTRFHINLTTPRVGLLAAAILLTIASAGTATAEDQKLSRKERTLIAGLVERGMPELIEPMIEGRPALLKIHVARAAARGAEEETDAAVKSKLIAMATQRYRESIRAAEAVAAKEGEPGRFRLAQWQLELADLLLRRVVGPDLDQFEISSGLAFDRAHAMSVLAETAALYASAGDILDDMKLRSSVDPDETYLLYGLSGKIGPMLERQMLNAAWCSIYRAMLSEPDARKRSDWVVDARTAFEDVLLHASDQSIRYNAQLGFGIAQRESRRFDEANVQFSRVIQSTEPAEMTSRAMYEMARSYIADGQFAAARQTLDQLKNETTDAEPTFYVRLGPLVYAYTYIAEAKGLPAGSPARVELEKRAEMEFVKLARQGGVWSEIVQVYLNQIAGAERDLTELTTVELGIAAGRWMADRQFERAVKAWDLLLARDPAPEERHLARFNKAVCLFQLTRLREAASIFLEEAKRPASEVGAPNTYDYAYRTWKQIAAETQSVDDYLTLAEAARLLHARRPDTPLAEEAIWVAALSLEEAKQYEIAIESYNEVRESSPNYWEARRNAARCRQRVYEQMPDSATIMTKQRMARAAIDVWKFLAERIDAELDAMRDGRAVHVSGSPDRKTLKRWRRDAILAAASIYAGDDLRDFDACLKMIENMEPDARQLGLRIRCYQSTARTAEANRALEQFIRQGIDEDLGGVLISLAADMQSEIEKLQRFGRRDEARRLAEQTVPTIRYLIEWLEGRPEHRKHVSVAQLALIDTLMSAGQLGEAKTLLDKLIEESPTNGTFLRRAARLQEDLAGVATGPQREKLYDEAESQWARLLADPALRTRAPKVYWEARYHWLKHQLRHGKAAEVVAGIESERAWEPRLGGPPWQGQLMDLLSSAQRASEMQKNP
ncbi:MAG: tetratricopeptide repeat protein [Phycisphaerales bacterium]|nr:tetratricopeptide repeat protein [Phycisphaerales bacterium]MCB9864669.1 tetratricopeptide repeat protein [Phycisphaerales bacterium]